jgi:hypothetical protein
MSDQRDLSSLFAVPVVRSAHGYDFKIHEIRLHQLPVLMPVIDAILQAAAAESGATDKQRYLAAVMQLVSQPGTVDSVFVALASLTDVGASELKQLRGDVLLALIAAVVEVNLNFFVQRLLPSIAAAVEQINTLAVPDVSQPPTPVVGTGLPNA